MSNLERLFAKGAECVGGSIILNRKELGILRDGDFIINDNGRRELEVVDVEAREVPAEKSSRRRPIRHTPADEPVVQTPPDEPEIQIEL